MEDDASIVLVIEPDPKPLKLLPNPDLLPYTNADVNHLARIIAVEIEGTCLHNHAMPVMAESILLAASLLQAGYRNMLDLRYGYQQKTYPKKIRKRPTKTT